MRACCIVPAQALRRCCAIISHGSALPEATPVLICGMAGARQGWVEAPYLKTPTRLDALHEGAVRVDAGADIRILPGIAQARADRPDVMRGEETQLLGVLDPGFAGLVCIPGTHSKWIRIEAGEIVEFATYMTGELFSVISQHSILSHAVAKRLVSRPQTASRSAKASQRRWLRHRD